MPACCSEDPSDLASVGSGKRLAQRGFSAVKFGWGGFGRDWRADIALVKTAREVVGDDIDLLIDVGLCWNARTALERAQVLAEFRLYWLEAPLPFYPVEAYAELRSQSPIQISCESAGGYRESQDAVDAASFTSSCPTSRMLGGIGEWKRIRRWRAPRAPAASALLQHRAFERGLAPPCRPTSPDGPDRMFRAGLGAQHRSGAPAFRAIDGYIDYPTSRVWAWNSTRTSCRVPRRIGILRKAAGHGERSEVSGGGGGHRWRQCGHRRR